MTFHKNGTYDIQVTRSATTYDGEKTTTIPLGHGLWKVRFMHIPPSYPGVTLCLKPTRGRFANGGCAELDKIGDGFNWPNPQWGASDPAVLALHRLDNH